MSREAVRRIMKDPLLSCADKLVGIVLYDRSVYGYCWLDKKTIAFEAGISARTVTKSINRLERRKYIELNNYAAGDRLPTNRVARQPRTLFRTVENNSGRLERISAPCIVGESVDNINMNGREYKMDKTLKSTRYNTLWRLFSSVRFATKDGSFSTVVENVANPETVCAVLSGPIYDSVDLYSAMHEAAAWTAEHKKNRRDRLGAFLRNWFKNCTKATSQPAQQPRYFEEL